MRQGSSYSTCLPDSLNTFLALVQQVLEDILNDHQVRDRSCLRHCAIMTGILLSDVYILPNLRHRLPLLLLCRLINLNGVHTLAQKMEDMYLARRAEAEELGTMQVSALLSRLLQRYQRCRRAALCHPVCALSTICAVCYK